MNLKSVFSAVDLVPTILDLAGVSHPKGVKYDGESLPDVLLGKSKNSRKQPLFFRRPPDRDSFYGVKDLPDLAVRSGKWKLLCEYDGSDPLLYDMEKDPQQFTNLSEKAEYATIKAKLFQRLRNRVRDKKNNYGLPVSE